MARGGLPVKRSAVVGGVVFFEVWWCCCGGRMLGQACVKGSLASVPRGLMASGRHFEAGGVFSVR